MQKMKLSKEAPEFTCFSRGKERREWMKRLRKDEKDGQLRDSRILPRFPVSAPLRGRVSARNLKSKFEG